MTKEHDKEEEATRAILLVLMDLRLSQKYHVLAYVRHIVSLDASLEIEAARRVGFLAKDRGLI